MKRREFLQRTTAGGLLGAAMARPALAQGEPHVRWRLATSWPKSLDAVFGSAEDLAGASHSSRKEFEIAPSPGARSCLRCR